MSNNMEIWEKVCVTPPDKTKLVSFGARKYTSICAQYQLKEATKLWGAFGSGWGVKNEEFLNITDNIMLYKAILYYPNGQIEIHSDIELINNTKNGLKYDEDWSKKCATDALTKGLSKLGFSADVFEGKFDNKYAGKQDPGNSQPQGGKRTISKWLTEKRYKEFLALSDPSQIKTAIDHWTSEDRGMKKDYKAALNNRINELNKGLKSE